MIHKKMDKLIRKLYSDLLLKFCSGEYKDYSENDFDDFVYEQIIRVFKLSVNELLSCNSMSMSKLIEAHFEYKDKLKALKNLLSVYCVEKGYIEDLSD